MTGDRLDELGKHLPTPATGRPPLHLWHPELSGDIDIVIHRDGHWTHEGKPIQRPSLVRLFASILRREADGDYYLVTPVEKWRVQVQGLPLQIVDFDPTNRGDGIPVLELVTNTEQRYCLGPDYPLFFADLGDQPTPAVGLDHGLSAQLSRAVWYRLVALAEERNGVTGVASGGLFFPLEPD